VALHAAMEPKDRGVFEARAFPDLRTAQKQGLAHQENRSGWDSN
jgi:hypothetical protein